MPDGFDWVAVYAVGVATGSLGFGVYRYVSGRTRKLAVEVELSAVRHPSYGSRRVISFHARNTGALPVRVVQCGLARVQWKMFRTIIKERLLLPMPSTDLGSRSFPGDVEPHQTFTCFADLATWCNGDLPDGTALSDYKRVYFVDGIGKYHSAKVPAAVLAEIESECVEATQGEKSS